MAGRKVRTADKSATVWDLVGLGVGNLVVTDTDSG